MKEKHQNNHKVNIMEISNLMIELTRKCNMKCKHCLRGTPQCVSLRREALKNIFENVEYIGALQFTGGEPLLALYQMRQIVDYLKWANIEIGYFWVKTNGTIFSKAFLKYLQELQNRTNEPDMCCMEFSLDQYHNNKYKNVIHEYQNYEYEYTFIKASENLQSKYNKIYRIIKEGRAKRLRQYEVYEFDKPSFYDGWNADDYDADNMIYVSANGNVMTDCNLSFNSIDKYSFGNIYRETLESIVDRNTKEEVKKIYAK